MGKGRGVGDAGAGAGGQGTCGFVLRIERERLRGGFGMPCCATAVCMRAGVLFAGMYSGSNRKNGGSGRSPGENEGREEVRPERGRQK